MRENVACWIIGKKLVDVANKDKLSSVIYNLLLSLHDNHLYSSPYLLFIENTLQQLGFSYIWYSQKQINISNDNFNNMIKQRLKDQYIQKWSAEIQESSLYYNYRIFKKHFILENYFLILPEHAAKTFFKFRSLNHKLPVQKGRILGIDRCERLCKKCSLNELGD